ncbi:MAG: acylphosphatase [Patescibacteria group bacterium]|nr:acylphosphatase [Patescibacteria group bacterium]
MKHFNVQIFGLVQGVGFRYSAYLKAQDIGITGFAKNMPDGSVYIEAEGREKDLEKFVEWLKIGPDTARVDRAKVSPGKLQNFQKFRII